MKNDQGIIHACAIDTGGHATILEGADISLTTYANVLTWVHLDANASGSRAWLEKEMSHLDQIIVDALLADETRPRIVEFANGALLILRGVNLNENAQTEDMVSIRLWIDPLRIVSLQRRPSKAVRDIFEKSLAGNHIKSSGDFLVQLVARLFERMEPVFAELDEDLDLTEELVMEKPDARERQKITSIRKKTIVFKRYIAPQKEVIASLRASEQPWLDPIHKRRLQESMDRVTRYMEDLDNIRERAQIIKDELANALADRMNKNLYLLSVVAAIFLPLGFFTGLLGINVGGIPGADNSDAFVAFCLILIGIVIVQIGLFKRLRWI